MEKLFVTNDAATIIRELEVVHPAAKLLVMASQQQEAEVDQINHLMATSTQDSIVCVFFRSFRSTHTNRALYYASICFFSLLFLI